jgi:sugar transferase (PEP-CTERM system associated)
VIRLFSVYFPLRAVLLLGGEVLLVSASFLLAVVVRAGADSYLVLNYESGYWKVLGASALAILCLYYFDLYDLQRIRSRAETYVRLVMVAGALSLILAVVGSVFPEAMIGRGTGTTLLGVSLLTALLFSWRAIYPWVLQLPGLRERVYVLGSGERAQFIVNLMRSRPELGMEVIGWAGATENGRMERETLGACLISLWQRRQVNRIIVALKDRRGTMPTADLLQLRLRGVRIDDATAMIERVTGKIEVDELNPSWLIFADGFKLSVVQMLVRRATSVLISVGLLVLVLPLLPLIALAIKLTSAGPVFYKQRRVGRNSVIFNCYKFRTMRADAEADVGPTWAGDDDPRITSVGRWLRAARLDEIPQLWNVLKGDMAFVGPRPERPEFVQWLSQEIPYYHMRHIVRPGITGWAQVSYRYGNTVEDAKEKLRYDLYYIKNLSLGLDLLILFSTVKTILLGRGAK